MKVDIGIAAYNEEATIGRILRLLLAQPMHGFELGKIYVVASGCTDGTESVVRRLANKHNQIKLIVENKRRGKASAINILLDYIKSDVLVLTDADVFPAKGSINRLVKFFKNKKVGATSGRPIPVDDPKTFWGFVSHLIWIKTQHDILLQETRQSIFFQLSGYLCAIRPDLISRIPENTLAEDKYLGILIKRRGYKVIYVPEAIVYIRGPKSLSDFLKQRRRVLTGHLQIKNWFNINISTSTPSTILPILIKNVKGIKEWAWAGIAAVLEGYAHLLAWKAFRKGIKIQDIWEPPMSTKMWNDIKTF